MNKFGVWMTKLDGLMLKTFGQPSNCFEDYNWFDEFDNDVDPDDAFEEWRLLTDDGRRLP